MCQLVTIGSYHSNGSEAQQSYMRRPCGYIVWYWAGEDSKRLGSLRYDS